MSNVYRYMTDAALLKAYKRFIRKAEREARTGFPSISNRMYEAARAIADEMDARRKS